MNNEDFEEDDDDFGPMVPYRLVESKPITRFVFIQAGFTIFTGVLRSVLEAAVDLSDAYVGHEGHIRNTKRFEDEARMSIESIVDGEDG